jgi:hypothetical protein
MLLKIEALELMKGQSIFIVRTGIHEEDGSIGLRIESGPWISHYNIDKGKPFTIQLEDRDEEVSWGLDIIEEQPQE